MMPRLLTLNLTNLPLSALLPIVAIMAIVAPASAQDDDAEIDYARTGGYIAGHLNAAWTSSELPRTGSIDWQPGFGMDIVLGWRETSHWAIEGQFDWITSADGIEYGTWTLGGNLKYFVLGGRIQPYLLIGANGMFTKQLGSGGVAVDWGFRPGIGVDYYLSEKLAITAQSTFVFGVGDAYKHYYLTGGVGVLYRF